VGELSASIAHEVRNPLAGMKGALEILRKELRPESLEIADELLGQIARLESLVRDLLTYARPRAIERQPFDLHELLDRVLRQYGDELDAHGVTVHRVYGPGSGRLVADALQMEQVFLNLIHNAQQAMTEGGTLTVLTRVADGALVITFQDTGVGIAPADLTRVFQPFYTTKHRGSGLGLSIVRKIVAAHGGTVQIASEPGQGASITVALPHETAR
jgi:signal transduction histidine kinase